MARGNLRSLAFLTPGNYPDDDPFSGLDATLALFAYGERLGFDGAWIRQRHLEHGVGSAAVFLAAQTRLIEEFSAFEAAGPVAVGRVVVPWDSADRRTRKRYQEYAAGRHDRTLRPHGERRTLFAPDLVGPAAEIAERLRADPVVAGASALRLELPYEFDREDYEQILTDTATLVAPGLGWTPPTR